MQNAKDERQLLLSIARVLNFFEGVLMNRPSRVNPLITLLTKFPDKDWNWSQLSKNPNISIDWMLSHPPSSNSGSKYSWDWINVCSNPNLSMATLIKFVMPQLDMVVKQKQKLWGKDNVIEYWWSDLSANLGINIVEILEHYAALQHDNVDSVDCAAKFKWNWVIISQRSDVTLEMMGLVPSTVSTALTASTNSIASAALIDSTAPADSKMTMSAAANAVLKANLSYFAASTNPNLTVNAVLSTPPELWDWRAIISNPSIPLTHKILNHPYHYCQPIFSTLLSSHPLLTLQYVLDHSEVELDGIIHKSRNHRGHNLGKSEFTMPVGLGQGKFESNFSGQTFATAIENTEC